MNFYQELIREELARQGRIDVDPRHVEGYARLEHGTLDGLSRGQFAREVRVGIACVDEGGKAAAENLARSYGL